MKTPRRGRPVKPAKERATAELNVRLTPERKTAFARAAGPRGLSEWVLDACDEKYLRGISTKGAK